MSRRSRVVVTDNLMSTPQQLDRRPHIMSPLGADIIFCLRCDLRSLYLRRQ